jgi:histidine triad (HIT) family protein
MDCLFCRIVEGTEPAYRVEEAAATVSFLDTRPVFKGHVLIVPRLHVATFTELPPDLVEPFFAAAQRHALAMTRGLGAHGSFVAMNNAVSQSVPHVHVHVVPRRRKDGLRGFFWPRQRYDDDLEASRYAGLVAEGLVSDS